MVKTGVALVAAALACAGCTVRVDTEERLSREEKRFKVTGQPDVRVATFDGSIQIRSWERDEVLVEVEKRGNTDEIVESITTRAEQDGNRIEVDVTRPSGRETFVGFGIHISPSARLIVTVPAAVTLQARSGDGSIRADRLEGRIELRTSDGSVRVSNIKGALEIDTQDGSIVAEDLDGEVTLLTGDGGISASGRLGRVKARSGDGSITIRADRGSSMIDDWSLITDDGAVAVYLPEQFGALIDAQTDDGRVRTDFSLQAARDDERRRRYVRGQIGEGGRELRVRTGDGSIALRSW